MLISNILTSVILSLIGLRIVMPIVVRLRAILLIATILTAIMFNIVIPRKGNPYWRGRLSTVDLLLLTSLDQLSLIQQSLFTFFAKQPTLMRRSTVLSLPRTTILILSCQVLPYPFDLIKSHHGRHLIDVQQIKTLTKFPFNFINSHQCYWRCLQCNAELGIAPKVSRHQWPVL